MSKLIITVGISASGKTTWAKEYTKNNKNTIISNRDDLRFSLTGKDGWKEYRFDKKIEGMITSIQLHTIEYAAGKGLDVIIADTNLNQNTREGLIECAVGAGMDYEIKDFPITLEEAWKRDAQRTNGVGRDVIYKQWKNWREYKGFPMYSPDANKPKAIIFDIDGTLAHMEDRGPFEWKKVGTDSVDQFVRQLLWDAKRNGYQIVLLSGRDGSCREETYQWTVDNGIPYDGLFMREAGDMRKDNIIKEELFWKEVAPHWNVHAVVDDRPQVVRMWWDLGIPKVINVGNPSLEF